MGDKISTFFALYFPVWQVAQPTPSPTREQLHTLIAFNTTDKSWSLHKYNLQYYKDLKVIFSI